MIYLDEPCEVATSKYQRDNRASDLFMLVTFNGEG